MKEGAPQDFSQICSVIHDWQSKASTNHRGGQRSGSGKGSGGDGVTTAETSGATAAPATGAGTHGAGTTTTAADEAIAT